MTALSADRENALPEVGEWLALPGAPLTVAASTTIYLGAVVCLATQGANAGYVVPASADASLIVLGVSRGRVDNSSGAAGAIRVPVDRRPHRMANSAGTDAITTADVGQLCYMADDQTVARTSGGGTRPVAGRVMHVASSGTHTVLVEFHGAGETESLPVATYVLGFGDLSDADLQETVDLGALEPGVYMIESELDTAFSGGTIATATATIGWSGNADGAASAFDIFTGASTARVPRASDSGLGFVISATTTLQVTVDTTVGNVGDATAGDLNIYVRRVRL